MKLLHLDLHHFCCDLITTVHTYRLSGCNSFLPGLETTLFCHLHSSVGRLPVTQQTDMMLAPVPTDLAYGLARPLSHILACLLWCNSPSASTVIAAVGRLHDGCKPCLCFRFPLLLALRTTFCCVLMKPRDGKWKSRHFHSQSPQNCRKWDENDVQRVPSLLKQDKASTTPCQKDL